MKAGERVLLLAHPRSGSSNLYEILELHPALRICNEPFNEDRESWAPGNKNYRELVHDWASLESVLDEIFASFNGLKVLSYQLPEGWVMRLIGRPDLRVIFIRRRNVLQAVVSVLISEQTGLWHRWDTRRAIESYYTALRPLDVADVRNRVHLLTGELQRLEKAIERRPDRAVHSLLYEELFFAGPEEQRSAMQELWSFIGVDPIDSDRIDYFLRPERSKLNSEATYRLVPNADEIERECGSDLTGHLFP